LLLPPLLLQPPFGTSRQFLIVLVRAIFVLPEGQRPLAMPPLSCSVGIVGRMACGRTR